MGLVYLYAGVVWCGGERCGRGVVECGLCSLGVRERLEMLVIMSRRRKRRRRKKKKRRSRWKKTKKIKKTKRKKKGEYE